MPNCLSDSALVARAARCLKRASTNSWEAADAFLELSRRGWGVRKIAEACGTNKDTVSRFIRCVKRIGTDTPRPPFWDVYRQVQPDGDGTGRARPVPPPPEGKFALILADPPVGV
jgi:hypothetical protein